MTDDWTKSTVDFGLSAPFGGQKLDDDHPGKRDKEYKREEERPEPIVKGPHSPLSDHTASPHVQAQRIDDKHNGHANQRGAAVRDPVIFVSRAVRPILVQGKLKSSDRAQGDGHVQPTQKRPLVRKVRLWLNAHGNLPRLHVLVILRPSQHAKAPRGAVSTRRQARWLA